MKTFQDFENLSFSTKIAILSFTFGSLLFFSFLLFPKIDTIIFIGIIYVIIAIFFNFIVLLSLLLQFILVPNERVNTLIKTLILLANVPIAFLYFAIVTKSFNSIF